MFETINEQVEMLIEFKKNKVIPIQMTWKGRVFKIKSIDFVHKSKEGGVTLHHFAISTYLESFKLIFNSSTLEWTLQEIYTTGFIKRSLNDKPQKQSSQSYYAY